MAEAPRAIEAYPLQWPATKPRARSRVSGRFKVKSIARCTKAILNELSSLGARGVVISSNLKLRQDGLPYSTQPKVTDPGVAVYFQHKGKNLCLACDHYQDIDANLWAIAKHVEATRAIIRWGVADAEAMFAGFRALPAPSAPKWWDILGLTPDASVEAITQSYRERARTAHPDAGGSNEAMARLNAARDEGLREVQR